MGQAVAALVQGQAGLAVTARFDRPGVAGEGLVERDAALAAADVVIDFTTAAASAELAAVCAARGGPALVLSLIHISEPTRPY